MATKYGKSKTTKPISSLSTEALMELSTQNNSKKDAHKARMEMLKRGLSI